MEIPNTIRASVRLNSIRPRNKYPYLLRLLVCHQRSIRTIRRLIGARKNLRSIAKNSNPKGSIHRPRTGKKLNIPPTTRNIPSGILIIANAGLRRNAKVRAATLGRNRSMRSNCRSSLVFSFSTNYRPSYIANTQHRHLFTNFQFLSVSIAGNHKQTIIQRNDTVEIHIVL